MRPTTEFSHQRDYSADFVRCGMSIQYPLSAAFYRRKARYPTAAGLCAVRLRDEITSVKILNVQLGDQRVELR
ncbi:MAG: hypothetical protein NT123_23995 [Proteobacteria bacterium]|nr:hypothetical protein [Pseudomonadota bacterium]